MGFTLDGLPWAGSIYQKFENMTSNCDMFQIPCNYAEIVTERIRQALDEFTDDWMDPAGSRDEEPVGDGNSREGLDKISSDEKLQTCVKVEPAVTIEDPSPVDTSDKTKNMGHDVSQKQACDKQSNKLIPTEHKDSTCLHGTEENCEATSLSKGLDAIFSDGKLLNSVKELLVVSSAEDMSAVASSDEAQNIGRDLTDYCSLNEHEEGPVPTEATSSSCLDNCENIANTVKSLTDLTTAPLAADGTLPFLSDQNKIIEGALMSSGKCSPTDVLEIHHEEELLKGTDIVDLNTELMGEFEDVDLHHSWDDNEDFKLASVLHQERKNRSYKKKLRAVLMSKLRLSKKYEQREIQLQNSNVGMQDGQGVASPSVTEISSLHNSLESDWEFL